MRIPIITLTRKNKLRVLFIGPKTFGYEGRIIEALEGQDYDVYFLSDTYFDSKSFKAFLRLFPRLGGFLLSFFYHSYFNRFESKFFQRILVIRGEGLSERTLLYIQDRFPGAKKVLYLWDSFRNINGIKLKLKHFDATYSFDSDNCREQDGLMFKPLFYLDEYAYKPEFSSARNESIFFIGTLHSNRTKILSKIVAKNTNLNFDYYLYCRTPLEYYFHYITDRNLRNLDQGRIVFKPMSADEVRQKLFSCNCVLDMQHPSNSGLTIRTFESLAAGTKLITFNHYVKGYDFYSEDLIHVVNFDDFIIDERFVHFDGGCVSDDFYHNYSVHNFVKYIMN